MNILFVNYGDFTTNSLNHIAGFAAHLTASGNSCMVAVPSGRQSISVVSRPGFLPAEFGDLLSHPHSFPDGRAADVIHAWTPREVVRKFVLEYQAAAHARLVVHLEDNEDFLQAAWLHEPIESLRGISEDELAAKGSPLLSHPRRYRHFLRVAEGISYIVESLGAFVPPGVRSMLLRPGVDFEKFHPSPPDPSLRCQLGLADGEKVIVFTGSNTFANEGEMMDLYRAVALLNARGTPTRLVRTGINSPAFLSALSDGEKKAVIDLGFIAKDRLPGLLSLADVLVQPGRAGPFNDYRLPSKLAEFLCAGRPVVLPATNIGRELRDGTDALLLRSGDPEEIAAACARVFADPALAATLGANAATFARRHFDPRENGDRLAAFYSAVMSAPTQPGSTSASAGGETEAALVLKALAARAPDADTAALAADLVPLVAQMEQRDPGRAERLRLERETERVRHHLELTRQHAANVEGELAAANKQIAVLRKQCGSFPRELAAASAERDAARAKIRSMQKSFSWAATAPLRLLRRALIDPWKRRDLLREQAGSGTKEGFGGPARAVGKSGVAVWYSVDNPQSWTLPPRRTAVRGWCFADDGRALAAVRARVSGRTVEAASGLKRLDVLATFRSKPNSEYCGWKLEIEFLAKDQELFLEARDDKGDWHGFFKADLHIGEGLGTADLSSYQVWVEAYDRLSPERLLEQSEQAARLARQPLISVLMPVYDTPLAWLTKAIDSVIAQSYPRWELCIADDASTDPHICELLGKYARADKRIRTVFRTANGHISASSNSALELATGEYVALLDHDDELAPSALFEVARVLNARPDARFVYSDEDKIDEEGRRHEPYFKPDFLPDLFHGQNYTSHLSVYPAALVREVGGFRPGYEGSQDWDLALRVVERIDPSTIVHIPRILYHWRAIPGSTALTLEEKSYPLEAARRALSDHFDRLGQTVELSTVPGDHWRVRHPLPREAPLVSLIIPTRNALKFLRPCVDSLLEVTTYPRFEVIVMDNGSDDAETLAYLHTLSEGRHPLLREGRSARVIRVDGPFNYSAINNRGVRESRGSIVALLNNDLEAITPDWLEEMAAQALRPEIGCVGAMLYYPNDTIQHAGVVLGLGGVAGHAFRDFPRGTAGRFNRARLVQNYSAVTAACLVVRKSLYIETGGLDAQELAVAFNDIDFCLKVRAAGYRNLWTPFAEFRHHESASRGADDTLEKEGRFQHEVETMMMRWASELTSDPAYNPNLTLEGTDFSLAVPPRPWVPAAAAAPAG